MTMIVVTIPTKTLKTIDYQAVTTPHEGPQNTLESMIPNPHDVAQRSIIDRGHVTPEIGGTMGEGGETETVTEIVRVSAEVVNTRKRIRRRRRRNEERVLVVGLGRAMKRISPIQTFSLEK